MIYSDSWGAWDSSNAWDMDPVAAVARARWLAPAALAELQRERLVRLLRHAVAASAFYRDSLRGIDVERTPLAGLPVVRKAALMRRFDEWVTDPEVRLPAVMAFAADPTRIGDLFLGRYAVWESSGSRGEPGIFLQDPQALAVYDALERQRPAPLRPWQRLLDPFWLAERVAFVGATDGHFASQASLQRLRRMAPWLADRWAGLSILQPLPALLQSLQDFAPTILTTYPTAASMLAEASADGRLDLRLSEVWTGGETLGAAQRGRIEAVFGCPLRNSYGASEFLPIAAECSAGALHLNADWVILEPVDERWRPVPPGTLSHTTLLTNLANRVQPLIRYDIGDRILVHAGRCCCGSPLPVIEVQGRCDDLLALAGPHGRTVRLLPLALSTVLEEEAGLFDFRLEQTGPSTLRLWLPAGRSAGAAVLALQRHAEGQGALPVEVRVGASPRLPRGRSGKLQRIVRCEPAAAQPPKRRSR